MKHYPLIILLAIGLFLSCEQKSQETVIAFGSCSHESDTAQLWNQILAQQPAAWIWMGDNIYGDTYDMELMRSKYHTQKSRPAYQKLIQSTEIYGVWDDHDYGINDGGKEYRMKDESKLLMLDFLDVPETNEVYTRSGAYQSYEIQRDGLTIKLILLDTRYFRDTLKVNINRPPLYHPNTEGTILGGQQWLWLERELSGSTADIHLIGSSIQLIPNDHGYEKWGNFPGERQRFFDLLKKTSPSRPIILSGDRHIAEFSKIDLDGLAYPLYEFTSSGLTHTWSLGGTEKNTYRVGDLIISKNFGIIEIEHNDDKSIVHINLKIIDDNNQVLQQSQLVY
jgi:alkaline phosphatase D